MSVANAHPPLAILVVEDEAMIRCLIVAHLREAGCLVTEAASADQAIAFLEKPFDAVFTDLRLGRGRNGWDVGEAFRAARADIPVIYATGNMVEPPRPVPGSRLFNKPYDVEEVVEACYSLCRAH